MHTLAHARTRVFVRSLLAHCANPPAKAYQEHAKDLKIV